MLQYERCMEVRWISNSFLFLTVVLKVWMFKIRLIHLFALFWVNYNLMNSLTKNDSLHVLCVQVYLTTFSRASRIIFGGEQYTVWHSDVLLWTVLYCNVLWCITLCSTVLNCSYIALYYTALYCTFVVHGCALHSIACSGVAWNGMVLYGTEYSNMLYTVMAQKQCAPQLSPSILML